MLKQHLHLYLTLIIIFVSSKQIKSKIDLGSPYSINGEQIVLNMTQSKLTQQQRAEYFRWVGIRDSFYYSGKTDQMLQLILYFSPEKEGYFLGLFVFGVVFFILGCLFFGLLILYLILRFGFKMFGGPKKYERSFGIITWIIIISGISLSFISLSIAIYHSNRFNSKVQEMLSYEDAQIIQMQSIYNHMLDNETELKNKPYQRIPIQTSISNRDNINRSHFEQIEKLTNLTSQIRRIQNPKFNYEIAYLFFVYILGIMGIGSYFYRKGLFSWIISFSIFVFSVPAVIILGLNCTYVILSTDFCQNIGKAIILQQAPTDSTGLGNYISCPSDQTIKYLRISMYEFSNSFNSIYSDVNTQLKLQGDSLPTKKRDNDAYKVLREKYSKDTVLEPGLNSLISTNNILASLLSQLSCQTAYNSIHSIEEQFCDGAINYLFQSIMIQMAGIIGTIILAIGINKLIIVINYKNSISLRGNKKYKDDLYEENLDASEADISFSKSRIN